MDRPTQKRICRGRARQLFLNHAKKLIASRLLAASCLASRLCALSRTAFRIRTPRRGPLRSKCSSRTSEPKRPISRFYWNQSFKSSDIRFSWFVLPWLFSSDALSSCVIFLCFVFRMFTRSRVATTGKTHWCTRFTTASCSFLSSRSATARRNGRTGWEKHRKLSKQHRSVCNASCVLISEKWSLQTWCSNSSRPCSSTASGLHARSPSS